MAFTSKLQTLFSAINLLSILPLLFFCTSEGTTSNDFTTDLIHRDSSLSPFYDPSITHFDRLHDSFQRSLKRVDHLKRFHNFKSALAPTSEINALAPTSEIDAPISPGGGEYLMKMYLGTPPVEIVGIADTGSDVTWTQCKPCIRCYKQIIPLFDSRHSSSYKTVKCPTNSCTALSSSFCGNHTCRYRLSYGDGSITAGVLATETLTLGSGKSLSFRHFAFGCSDNSAGLFDKSGSGIIGLGRGKLSLISQLGRSIGKKFSYCLAPTYTNATSKISFGNDSLASSNRGRIVTTPLGKRSNDNYYYLSLEGFTVGNYTIPYNDDIVNEGAGNGNIIIDSGTTFTLLPSKFYEDFASVVHKVIKGKKVKDPGGIFRLCYKDDGYNIQLPNITAHFKGGDVTLQEGNTFAWVSYDVVCLAMISSNFPIYGNLAQTNFKVGFNLEAGTLSFQPTDCVDL